MRIYQNFEEALSEIKRDVAEMGTRVHTQTYQDKFIGDDPDFESLELQNYIYTVVNVKSSELEPTQPWADLEWGERLSGINGNSFNPGVSWLARKELWEQFLDESHKFAYTYSERLSWFSQVCKVINRIKKDPNSRQLFISIWDPSDIQKLGGVSRVPCTLGYLIQCREKAINLTYLQRSADVATHLVNDIYLAVRLQEYISESTDYPVGKYSHWLGSLHAFKKDLKDIF
jgi:thymidylate synthase